MSLSWTGFSRNFEEGVRIQAEMTGRDIGIVAVRENIDTRAGSAAAKFFRRSMLAQGAYQVDSASERIKLGLDRARGNGKKVGRPQALTPDQIEQYGRMADEGAGLRQIARVMTCSPATVKKALAGSTMARSGCEPCRTVREVVARRLLASNSSAPFE